MGDRERTVSGVSYEAEGIGDRERDCACVGVAAVGSVIDAEAAGRRGTEIECAAVCAAVANGSGGRSDGGAADRVGAVGSVIGKVYIIVKAGRVEYQRSGRAEGDVGTGGVGDGYADGAFN